MNETIKNINNQSSDNIIIKSQKSYMVEIVLAILALIFLALFINFLCLYIHEKNKDKSCNIVEQNFKLSQDQFIPVKENINDGEGAYELRGAFDKTNS